MLNKIEKAYLDTVRQIIKIDTIPALKLALKIRDEYRFFKSIIDIGCSIDYALELVSQSGSIIAHKLI